MDFPTPFLFLVSTTILSFYPGSCYTEDDIREAQVAVNLVYSITLVLFVASAIISSIVVCCYMCKCCPVAQRQLQEGTILSLPQPGGPVPQHPYYPMPTGSSEYPGPPMTAPPYYSAGHQQGTPFPLEMKEPLSNC